MPCNTSFTLTQVSTPCQLPCSYFISAVNKLVSKRHKVAHKHVKLEHMCAWQNTKTSSLKQIVFTEDMKVGIYLVYLLVLFAIRRRSPISVQSTLDKA